MIDTSTNTVTDIIPVGSPSGMAVSPDGELLYVTNFTTDTVSVIDTATNAVVNTIAVGRSPASLAVSPDGTHLYVVNFEGNTVSVIDTATNTVIQGHSRRAHSGRVGGQR